MNLQVRGLKSLKNLVHRPKTTMIFSHSASPTDSFKFGTLDYVVYKQFMRAFEDAKFGVGRETILRGRMPNSYTKDEVRNCQFRQRIGALLVKYEYMVAN